MPSETLGVYTEALDRRFDKMEKGTRDKLLEAMRWEDTNLKKHIEKHRLDHWATETRHLAEKAVDHEYDVQTVEGAISKPQRSSKANGQANAL